MPFMRWRTILANWINCYDGGADWQSHPEQALGRILDKLQTSGGSTADSSLPDEQNLAGFVAEKYPEFQFENGTTSPSSDDDLFMVASLLLFFVCVKSKDAELRNTMCRKLKREDQEVVLKFTKNLMNKTEIKYADVCTAIIESTGAPAGECVSTPPPLRALHGEVRRLRAALDAERFDRAYLQDELSATSVKLDKLVKVKEQYQKEIATLKTQLSDQQNEPQHSSDSPAKRNNKLKKLQRQLSAVEEKLIESQGMLEDSERARQMYQNKLEELKRQRDECASHASAEMSRARVLAEQLEAERGSNQALLETLAELRASRELRGRDTSVECDEDPSSKSFQHDQSICGEACTTIVEMQLLEERARVVSLSEELATYQDKVKDLQKMLTQKDNEIALRSFDLKEEIKAKEEIAKFFSNQQSEMQLRLDENLRVIQTITLEVDRAKNEMEIKETEYKNIIKKNQLHIKEIESTNVEIQARAKESIEALNDKVHNLTVKEESMIKHIHELQNELKSKVSYLTELSCEKNKLIEKTKIMSETIKDISSENNKLMKEIKDATAIISTHKQQMEQLQIEFVNLKDSSESTFNILLNKLNNLNIIKDTLQDKITERNQLIANNNYQLDQLKNCINQLTDENKVKNMDIDLLKTEKDNLMKIITSHESEILLLNKEGEQQQKQIQNVYLEKENLETKGIEFENIIKNYQFKIEHLQNDNLILTNKAAETSKSIQEEMEKSNSKRVELENVIIDYEQLIRRYKDEAVRIQAECEQKLKTLSNDKLVRELNQVEILKETQMPNINELEKLMGDMLRKISNLTKLLENAYKEKSILENSNEELTKLVTSQQSQVTEAEKSLNKLNKQVKNHILSINVKLGSFQEKLCEVFDNKDITTYELDKSIKQYSSEHNNIGEFITFIEEQMNKTAKILEKLASNYLILKSENSQMNDCISEQTMTIESKMQQIDSFTRQIDALNAELQDNKQENYSFCLLNNELRVSKELLQKEYDAIVISNDNLSQKLSNVSSKLELDTVSFDNKSIELEKMVDENIQCNSIIASYRFQIEALETEIECLLSKVKEIESSNRELQSQGDQYKTQIAELKVQLQKLHKENKLLSNEKDEFKILIDQLQKEKNEFIIDKEESSAKLSNMWQQLNEIKETMKVKVNEHNDIVKVIKHENEQLKLKASESINTMTKQINEINESRTMFEKEISWSIEEYRLQIKKLEESNSIYSSVIESYKSNIDSINSELDSTKSALQDLSKDNESLKSAVIEYKTQIIKLSTENKELKSENLEKSTTLSNKIHDLNTLQHCLEEQTKEYNNLAYQLKRENELLQSEGKEMSRLIIAKNKETGDTFKEHEKTLYQLSTTIDNNSKQILNLQNECAMLKTNEELLTSQIKKLNTINMELENKLKDNENVIRRIEQVNVTLKEEKESLELKLTNISSENTQLMKQKNILTLEIENKSKVFEEELTIVHCKTTELEHKINEQESEISKLREKNCLILQQNNYDSQTSSQFCDKIISIIGADIAPEKLKSDQKISKEIEELICINIRNLKDTVDSIKSINFELQDHVSNLTSEIKSVKEDTYSFKLKLKIIISQNNGYLDTMIKDTNLFENKYSFVDVSQESCHVPDGNDSFEHFIRALENILLRNKTIANVYKTEFKSLAVSCKQLLIDKENEIVKLKKDYENKLQCSNNQLIHSKQIVTKLEENISVMETNKDTTIKNLNEQLEVMKTKDFNTLSESRQRIEELNSQLENRDKLREASILQIEENFKTKEESLKKHYTEQIELLAKELCESKNMIARTDKCLFTLASDVAALMNNFKSNLLDVQISVGNAIDIFNHPPPQEMVMINHVGSLSDEDKINSTLSNKNDFDNIIIDFKKLIDAACNQNKDTKHQLKIETDKTIALQTELLTKKSLVESLKLDIAKAASKLNDVNTKYKEAIEQNHVLSDQNRTLECEIKIYENKLKELESNVTENDKMEKEPIHKLKKVTSERDTLKEKLNVIEASLTEFINFIKISITISELGRPDFNETFKKLIDKMNPDRSFVQKLNELLTAINDIKDRNEDLKEKYEELQSKKDTEIKVLIIEVEALKKSIASKEDLIKDVQKSKENDKAELQMQVKTLLSNFESSSKEQNETINNLEKIIHDKNKTITTLQSDITYMKSLVAESENKLLDMTKEYEQTKENYQQLSAQSKKSLMQKDVEIENLRKQLNKLSIQESSANKIIKLSAKYHAMILKRIAELKSSNVLRELTHITNIEGEKKSSLSPVGVTTDDLESFLEGTDQQLRKLAEKQIILQKERDRLAEVCKINESEILSLKRYLTDLLAHFKTFTSVKEVYNHKINQVLSKQRLVRREIHSLDQNLPDSIMSKLERSYSIVMQDLCETSMNLGRWAEKCIDRSISPEKLKQVFANSEPLLSTSYFHNTQLEIQIEELMTSFQKIYEEVQTAKSIETERPVDAACSVMQVRAEYEDKLNRMKAKMKQLYQEQISAHQSRLDSELDKMRRKMEEKSRAYEEHIKSLTEELWSVGEKLLMKKEEADWLKQRHPSTSGSLMSLQMVHSSGLTAGRDSWQPRAQERARTHADTQSLHRFAPHKPAKQTNRGFHMSDEEGEVFDNRFLRELETPTRDRGSRRSTAAAAGQGDAGAAGRVSELKYRNSLCPPHLKSSYPAETHFAPLPINEDEIKFESLERRGRKEVGITAYKKPGPPTPSKNAGRLSATDSELRESLRSDPDAVPVRKTSTPSRLRALFRSNRSDTENSTPKSKRLSIFRKRQ